MQAVLSTAERALVASMRSLGRDLLEWRRDDAARSVLSPRDLKLQADRWAHERLSDTLREQWPDVPIVSEEDAHHAEARPGRYWLIDPIDGTASWLHGFPGFVTQAALIEDAIPVAGFVFAPALDRFYTGMSGRGAWLDDVRLTPPLRRARLATVDNTPAPHGIVARLMQHLPIADYVESGSLGLKCCLVASGVADVFVKDVRVRDWDLAPAAAIFREIGACLMTPDGAGYRFEGPWEKTEGFIAARDGDLAGRVAEAIKELTRSGGHR